MGFVGRKPTNAPLTSSDLGTGIVGSTNIADGSITSAKITDGTITSSDLAPGAGGIAWQSVQTTGFTAVAGTGYPCNTTSSAFTVTLPATPSAGDQVQLVDYAGTFDTNALTIDPNGEDIEGGASALQLKGEREGVILTYIDSTQGWIATSGINEGTDALEPIIYSADFLVLAGGGAGDGYGGGGAGGYRSSNATYGGSGGGASAESSLTFTGGTVYTITVGAGGPSTTNGFNSVLSGTGITTITSIGGGTSNAIGGSGGGGYNWNDNGASGTANQGYAGGNGTNINSSPYTGGGGGGASAVGVNATLSKAGNGGAGKASTITGSSITRGGGGGGSAYLPSGSNQFGDGGVGGGGNGSSTAPYPSTAVAGTVNTGGGGGANSAGGSGVVILRMPTANYSGTSTGSPTVGTDGTDTILTFTGSGSYTG